MTRCSARPQPAGFGTAVLLAALLLLAPPAWAHHGWSGYHNELQTLSGQVSAYEYIYPHAALSLTTNGKSLQIVLAPPSRMGRRGLEALSIKPGDTVTVEGYVHRQHDTEMRAERITVNGQTHELR